MRILHLYRPRLPTSRAQAIQVIHTCHALAHRGHAVTLLADRIGPADADAMGSATTPEGALSAYGLDHPDGLDLRIAPARHPTAAGLWFRWERARWTGDLVYARAKRYVADVPAAVPVVVEAHEVDSLLDAEAGRDPDPNRRLEAAVYTRASGVVTNCPGTLARLATVVALPRHRAVIWNATRADRVVTRRAGPGRRVGYAGSPREWKGVSALAQAVERWPADVRLELLGGGGVTHPRVDVRASVPYAELPESLARFDVLLLPLLDNLYGRWLANPLKLWDYLATGIPIVAADLPTVREVAGDRPFYYPPGDMDALAQAVGRALTAGPQIPLVRTWDDRAADIERFLVEVMG